MPAKRVSKLQRRELRRAGARPREIRRYQPILTAQIGAESNFTQGVRSPAGAQDIAQFMPGTAPGYGVTLGDGRIKDDIRGQVRYMLPLLRQRGIEDALRGYNAGVGAIERSHGFSETNEYVRRVRSSAGQYRGLGAGAGGGGGRARGGGAARRGRRRGREPGEAAGFDPGTVAALQSALGDLGPPEARVPGGSLAPPIDARESLALPEGYQMQQGQAPAPPLSLADRLAELTGGGMDVAFGTPQPAKLRREARERQGKGGLKAAKPERLISELGAWASDELGLAGGSRDRDPGSNAAVGGASDSDHLEGGGRFKGREAIDLPTSAAAGGWGQYRKVARKLGLKPEAGGFTQGTIKVGGKKFRVQVIFGDAHGHGDHIHVGIRRV